jgi:hypothetical protein
LYWGLRFCSSWVRWRTSSEASSIYLCRSASRAIFSFFLCTCWCSISIFLISWSMSSSWGIGLVAFLFWLRASQRERVSWFGSSGCRAAAPVAEAFFGGMTKVDACRRWSKRVHRRSVPMLGTCSQMLWVKNKATQRMLNVKVLRPSKHYNPFWEIMFFGRRLRRTYLRQSNIWMRKRKHMRCKR